VVGRPFFFLFIFSLSGFAQGASQPVLDVLMRMQTALQNLNYHGTLVYLQDGQVQSMRVIHKASESGEYERLVNLNGVAREVIRKDDVVTCYMPDKKKVTVGKRQYNRHMLSKLAENDFSALREHYDFKLEAEDRIAGLKAQRVLIQPRDKLRYGYRLWLGKKDALLLKSDLLNVNGKVLEQVMFADINIVDKIPMEMLKPASASEGFSWFEHGREDKGHHKTSENWKIKSLPKGFSVSSHVRQSLPDSDQPTEQWIATDGLASVSIYVEKLTDGNDAFEGIMQKGAMNIFGLLLSGHQVTVVGEVPTNTVEMIARSVVMIQ
jgi:sigma-E factor negative regulatory protein RseB